MLAGMAESEMTGPELSVICPNPRCGQEVSPYVTECPYCGTRIRKRAPELKREGDRITIREGRQERRRRKDVERRRRKLERPALVEDLGARPVATGIAILLPALAFVALVALGKTPYELGAIVGTVGSEWWRYLTAPFVYDDAGYLFVCALCFAIFLPGIERRIGVVGALLLVVACGALGALAAEGIRGGIGNGFPVVAGGNGIALGVIVAYVVLREPERRADPDESYDPFAVAVAAAVIALLPLVEEYADPIAAVAGALVGAACGALAALSLRRAR